MIEILARRFSRLHSQEHTEQCQSFVRNREVGNERFFSKVRPVHVIGPLGLPVTMVTLPPRGTTRWVARRKAEVLAAISGGLLSIDEACERYDLSVEELTLWQQAIRRPGLRVKQIQSAEAVHERHEKSKSAKIPSAMVDVVLTPTDDAQSCGPADQQLERALQRQW